MDSLILFLILSIVVIYGYKVINLIMKSFTKKERNMLAVHTVQPYQYDQLVQYLYKKAYNMEKLADWERYKGRTVIIIDIAYHDVISVIPIEEIKSDAIYYTKIDFDKT